MRKAISFILTVACVLAARASGQTYGGAATGDLLGYRSSSAHYYNRGAASRKRAARRGPRARPARSAVGKVRRGRGRRAARGEL